MEHLVNARFIETKQPKNFINKATDIVRKQINNIREISESRVRSFKIILINASVFILILGIFYGIYLWSQEIIERPRPKPVQKFDIFPHNFFG